MVRTQEGDDICLAPKMRKISSTLCPGSLEILYDTRIASYKGSYGENLVKGQEVRALRLIIFHETGVKKIRSTVIYPMNKVFNLLI